MDSVAIKAEIKKSLGVTTERHASRLASLIAAGERQLSEDSAKPQLRLLSKATRQEIVLRLEIAREIQAEMAVAS